MKIWHLHLNKLFKERLRITGVLSVVAGSLGVPLTWLYFQALWLIFPASIIFLGFICIATVQIFRTKKKNLMAKTPPHRLHPAAPRVARIGSINTITCYSCGLENDPKRENCSLCTKKLPMNLARCAFCSKLIPVNEPQCNRCQNQNFGARMVELDEHFLMSTNTLIPTRLDLSENDQQSNSSSNHHHHTMNV